MTRPRPSFREADFRKSSYSDPNQECVHMAQGAGWVEMRDTKTDFGSPADGRLAFTTEHGRTFLGAVQADRFSR